MIDLHTHLHPPRLFAAIRRWFAERSDWDISKQPCEPRDVARVLRDAGVERFVYCSYAHKRGMAQEINAWLTQTARDLDGFGVPLATIHLDDDSPLDDLHTALDAGCIGLKVHEDVQSIAVDDGRFDPIFDEMSRRGAFLLVHVGPIPWAYPAGSGPQRIARVLTAHPMLNVVVAHMGLPDTRAYCALMRDRPRLHVDTTMVFAEGSPLGGDPDIDGELVAAHASRIVYGTDFPNVPYAYPSERHGLERLGLAPEALTSIVHDNAARLIDAATSGIAR